MLEDLAQWVERVDQLTYDMEEFLMNASVFGSIAGFAILVIFILTIKNYAMLRKLENKVDYLTEDIADLYNDRFTDGKKQ